MGYWFEHFFIAVRNVLLTWFYLTLYDIDCIFHGDTIVQVPRIPFIIWGLLKWEITKTMCINTKMGPFRCFGDTIGEPSFRCSKPEQPKDVLTEVQSETDSDREDYDLESMEDATKYMLAHWPKKDRESCRPVVAFFREELKRESCKTKPFSSLITLKIINPGQLNSKKGRSTFLSAWRANRARRYAPKPKVH